MRTEFEMTQEDLDAILEASKPVTAMLIGSIPPRSPQQNANDAWAELGRKMGFDHMVDVELILQKEKAVNDAN